jgi:hypothetical protein
MDKFIIIRFLWSYAYTVQSKTQFRGYKWNGEFITKTVLKTKSYNFKVVIPKSL